MDTLFEQRVIHNHGLVATAIAQSVIRFDAEVGGKRGMHLFAALLVPALVFHRRTAETFANKQMTEGLFFRAVADDREIVVGVHHRLRGSVFHAMSAIHLGCSSELLIAGNDDGFELHPGLPTLPRALMGPESSSSVRVLLSAAKRLGYCFATTDFAAICAVLRVRF